MKRLTANQLILLLEIYRASTFNEIGTTEQDLKMLKALNLVEKEATIVTDRGHLLVNLLLDTTKLAIL